MAVPETLCHPLATAKIIVWPATCSVRGGLRIAARSRDPTLCACRRRSERAGNCCDRDKGSKCLLHLALPVLLEGMAAFFAYSFAVIGAMQQPPHADLQWPGPGRPLGLGQSDRRLFGLFGSNKSCLKMKTPLGETIAGGIFRTSLIGVSLVLPVCAKAIVGHAKAQVTTIIIALFIVPILVQFPQTL
jgi:hypothetical protein